MVLGLLGILPAVAVVGTVHKAVKKLPTKSKAFKKKRTKTKDKYSGLAWK